MCGIILPLNWRVPSWHACRNGLRVHVLYDQQFTTNSAAAHQAAAAAVHGRGGSLPEFAAAAAADLLSGAGGGSGAKRRGSSGGAGGGVGGAKKARRPAGQQQQQQYGGGGGEGGAAGGGGGQWYFRDGVKVRRATGRAERLVSSSLVFTAALHWAADPYVPLPPPRSTDYLPSPADLSGLAALFPGATALAPGSSKQLFVLRLCAIC